jgi:Mrp family chromosome partitioning ATPase/capsular polysaccharide biosynthesis protein
VDLSDHLRIIWRRRWVVLGLSLVLAGLVFARSHMLTKVYRSEAQLSLTAADPQTSKDKLDFLVGTYTGLATTRPVLADAVRRAGLRLGIDEAGKRIAVASSSTGGLLKVSTTGPSPRAARSLADGEATALASAVQAGQRSTSQRALRPLDDQLRALRDDVRTAKRGSSPEAALRAEYQAVLARRAALAAGPVDRLDVVQPATTEGTPISPTPTRDAIVALFVALVVNAELMVVLQALGDRFGGDAQEGIRSATGLPILTVVPEGDGPASVEAFRRLRTSVAFAPDDRSMRTVAVVGLEPRSGKTRIAVGLARQTAAMRVPVVLVDADLRDPGVHQHFGLERSPGIGDIADGEDPDPFAVDVADEPGLRVIPAGSPLDDPGARLSTGLAKTLALLGSAELIVIDTPAAAFFVEAQAVAAQCDGTIVVVEARTSHRRELVRLVEQLNQLGARPLGVVLNRASGQAALPTPPAP